MDSPAFLITAQQIADLRAAIDDAARQLARFGRVSVSGVLSGLPPNVAAPPPVTITAALADQIDVLRSLPRAHPPESLPTDHYDKDRGTGIGEQGTESP